MGKLNVVFVADKDYIQHFTVACTSLLENNISCVGRIFLLHDIPDELMLKEPLEYFKRRYSVSVEAYRADAEIFRNCQTTPYLPATVYIKLLIPEILPGDIDEVLYLDSDIIVNAGISELAGLYSGTAAREREAEPVIRAVNCGHESWSLERLSFSGIEPGRYFNAGVMYMNLRLWRELNLTAQLIENSKKFRDRLLWCEQDVLNAALHSRWAELDCSYNAFDLTSKSRAGYKIIHYAGSVKPWHYVDKHPYKKLYWKYLRLTPYKNYVPDDFNFLNIIKRAVPRRVKNFIKTFSFFKPRMF